MKPQDICRERAEQCLIRAEMTTEPEARRAMLDAAHQWSVLADMAELYARPSDTEPGDKSSR